jgi:putative DNA primase/helicase
MDDIDGCGEALTGDDTEDGLALRFTERHGGDLRYVNDWGRWLRWDGSRWAEERTLAVFDLARNIAREAADETDERVARRIKASSTVAAIVTLARADRAHARTAEDFDRDPWALNTPAGTINLRTGAMRPARRGDHMTKRTAVAPFGIAPLWRECLDVWTDGDGELQAFLQRFAGYSLTGSVREEVLLIVYGPGGNGKSKWIETQRQALGPDYAGGVAMETLVVTHGEQHPTDLADLRGKRLAVAVETEEGRRLAEAKIKQLTGGDRLRARFMRRDYFEFDPTHKLVIVGNHKPALRNVDAAMRRRVLLVPFEAEIPEGRRDRGLAGKLTAELPGILAWMIEGCQEWQAGGLRPPARVLAATEAYLESADSLARWADEALVFGPNESCSKASAFAAWKTWAEASGEFVGSQRRLGEWLSRRSGIVEHKGTGGERQWRGLGLRSR